MKFQSEKNVVTKTLENQWKFEEKNIRFKYFAPVRKNSPVKRCFQRWLSFSQKKTLQDYSCTLTDLQSSKMPLPIIMNWKITPRVLSQFPSWFIMTFSWKGREIIGFSKAHFTHTKHSIFGSSVANNLSGIHLLNKMKNFSSRITKFYEGNKHKYNPKCLTFWQWFLDKILVELLS